MPVLPDRFEEIVREGVAALGWMEAVMERRIPRSGERASDLLALRGVDGLAGRLAGTEPHEWREGSVRSLLSPRDVAELEEWEEEARRIVHSPDDPDPTGSWHHPARLRALRRFLERYLADG